MMSCGHVPGSLNLLVETVVDAESRMFKSPEDIKAGETTVFSLYYIQTE